ncbi:50S ribosomal protein L11 methyltransferase [Lactobacillus sp. YT155]|uniref:50S ribosomal protein L11 methyltransferase n=1 Tax=Lactobacillus sp. YT155 TaxID=3060955 RepID=UPI00265ED27B|nr:50S ribosomal protein L11 methyltransferase [Lactobacillus sp. YT155]MDO1605479.1 50S ribosomal protein L11 methyltransferase [Lactobacillus sp. YT155]
MKWTKLTIKVAKNDFLEVASTVLINNQAQGVEIDDTKNLTVSSYFSPEIVTEEYIKTIHSEMLDYRLSGVNISADDFIITQELIDDESWKNEWKKYYHPTRISRYLVILPKWESDYIPKKDENVILMDPGESFGTGTHPTTFSCLQALEMVINDQESMFDVGTGSGILSIAARKMGIKRIKAYDNDQIAVDASIDNLQLNDDCRDIEVKKNSLLSGITEKVDIIVANILTEILLDFIPVMSKNLNPNGTVVLSGILNEQEELITNELGKIGFSVISIIKKDSWSTFITKKTESDEV